MEIPGMSLLSAPASNNGGTENGNPGHVAAVGTGFGMAAAAANVVAVAAEEMAQRNA